MDSATYWKDQKFHTARHRPGSWVLFFLLIAFAALGVAEEASKRVLILNPYDRDVEPFSSAVSSFRSTLARELAAPVDFHEIPLELARFTGEGEEEPLVSFLDERIKAQPVDLVVPIGGAGTQFASRHRSRLFPEVPILVVAAEPRMIPEGFLDDNATLVTERIDLAGMVEDILQMQPDTERIAVVFGSSPLEKFWAEQCRQQFQSFSDRLEFVWLNDLPIEEMLSRAAHLPPKTFIFHGLYISAANGIPCEKNEALRQLNKVASAPVFACFASEFGLGPAGGHLFQNSEIGEQGALVASRILRGEAPAEIPPTVLDRADPIYDWRELKRWNIDESLLPENRIIAFRQPGFWERYRWQATGVALLIILQAALTLGLLINRTKRLQSEELNRETMKQSLELRSTLAHSDRVNLLGQLATSIAHELSQPLGAILRNAEAAEIILAKANPDLEEIRAIVHDILSDDNRAGQVIDKLRALLKKGRLETRALDVNTVIEEVLKLLHADSAARQVELRYSSGSKLPLIQGDRIHLQQVLLNLIINSMDILKEEGTADPVVQVSAHLVNSSVIEVQVCDNGRGIPEEHLGRLFEPFFTSQ